MPSPLARLQRLRRAVRRAVLGRRRLLAALCAGIAVAAGVRAASAPPPPTVPVMTAAHDLEAGAVLRDSDLRPLQFAPDSVPGGLVSDAVGRTLAAPVRAGEPITDVRLVGQDLARAHRELATMPVRLPDAGQLALLSVGDRIDLVATDAQRGDTTVVTSGALVLALPRADDSARAAGTAPGGVVVLGVRPEDVVAVADAAARSFLSYVFTP